MTVGEWELLGGHMLRRCDGDGTVWTVERNDRRPALEQRVGWHRLTFRYRDIVLTSYHPDIAAAKRHVDDMLRAWKARTLREYQGWVG